MPDLSNTALVILGMLHAGPKSGYDIKVLVDHSTRFFWSASYGQIYPELRELEEGGLVHGEAEARGGRARTVYELTPAGAAALRGWLAERGPLKHEIRDEGLLKFFFAEAADPEDRLANLVSMKERFDALSARLRDEVVPLAEEATKPFALLTARFGVDYYDWLADWCRRTEAELRSSEDGPPPDPPSR